MAPTTKEVTFEGLHCNLTIEKRGDRVVLMKITGTDIGEFGDAPMESLEGWIKGSSTIELFIDARDVRGASIEVSGQWAGWLDANRKVLGSVTMLTGSRLIQVTAEFVRRFSSLEGSMRICTDPEMFDHLLVAATRP